MPHQSRIFDSKTRKQFQRVLAACANYIILCKMENGTPSVVVMGDEANGKRQVSAANISLSWITEASCLDQFVAAVIDGFRELLDSGDKFEQRRALLSKVFVHAELLPHFERS